MVRLDLICCAIASWPGLLELSTEDDAEPILYIDDRRFSRIYEMSFKNGVWKIWRNAPKFVQRFEGKISKDKNTITGSWGKSFDGKKWEHDFDLVYKRVEQKGEAA